MFGKILKLSFLSIASLWLFAGPLHAQGTEFTYQGRLLSSAGPASGAHDFEFLLWDAADGGSQLGQSVALTSVNVNNGVFSVRLDFGNQFPGANRYLEIRVRQAGDESYTVLAPRQAITSSPYSIKSLNAEHASSAQTAVNTDRLGGISAGNYVVTNDPRLTDERNPLPGSGSYIQNSTQQQVSSDFNVSGTGTAAILNATTRYDIAGQRVLAASGASNIFVGRSSGGTITTGTGNSFLGESAGANTSTGNSNTFIGNDAGVGNNAGTDNSFVGSAAGLNSNGHENSFFGSLAGRNNTSGSANSFIGKNAGIGNANGSGNTVVGSFANVGAGGLTNATAVGFRSLVSSNNSLVLGSITGVNGATASTNVGIGTTAPGERLHVVGNSIFTGNLTISDTGAANVLNANTQFNLNGSRVLSAPGVQNTFVGFEAGVANTTGAVNTFFGVSAGAKNTTGSSNAYFGNRAGANNVAGLLNSFFGSEAGGFGSAGIQNSFFGVAAGTNTSGNDNAFFGAHTGRNTTSGFSNAFFGAKSGQSNVTGRNNTILGAEANVGADGLVNATAIGFRSQVSQSNSLVLGSISGLNGATASTNVGIGTTAPTERLHVGGNGLITGSLTVNGALNAILPAGSPSYIQNQAGSAQAANFNISGNGTIGGNVGIGTTAPGYRLTVGEGTNSVVTTPQLAVFRTGSPYITVRDTTNNIEGLFGADPSVAGGSAGTTIFGSMTSHSLSLRTANSTRMVISPTGNVGVNTVNPLTRFHVNGSSIVSGSLSVGSNVPSVATLDVYGTIGLYGLGTAGTTQLCRNGSGMISQCSSSLRYKSNVLPLTSGLSLINRLRPVSFNWLSDNTSDIGLVAEEVAAVEPLLTVRNDKGEVEGVKYDRIGVVLINAVNEQQVRIESQQQEIEKQGQQVIKQEAQIKDLQTTLHLQRILIENLRAAVCRQNPHAEVCQEEKQK